MRKRSESAIVRRREVKGCNSLPPNPIFPSYIWYTRSVLPARVAYTSFVRPRLAEIFAAAKRDAKTVMLHSRGNVHRLKRDLGAGGGYIIEPGITIQADVPLENILALVDAART